MIVTEISTGEVLAALSSITVLIAFLWNGIGKPNKKQDEKIIHLEDCFSGIHDDMKLIKENHLPHIERDMNKLSETIVRVETILEERLPRKQ